MRYDVQYSENARKALKKIDSFQSEIIISWIGKNLLGCENPRLHGKPLSGDKKDFWRYRVGAYRIITDIQDSLLIIEIIKVGHRREIYDN